MAQYQNELNNIEEALDWALYGLWLEEEEVLTYFVSGL